MEHAPLLPEEIFDKTMLVKLPADLHTSFREICERNHTTMSEAIRQYMKVVVGSGQLVR